MTAPAKPLYPVTRFHRWTWTEIALIVHTWEFDTTRNIWIALVTWRDGSKEWAVPYVPEWND